MKKICLGLLFALQATVNAAPLFVPVVPYSQEAEILQDVFNKILTPLYGSQDSAIEKILNASDRDSFVAYNENNDPIGLLVYKNQPTEEFAEYGAFNSLEIKTLFLIDAEKNSGKGYGSMLYNQLESVGYKGGYDFIHVTVSEDKPESIAFFKKKGFKIAAEFIGKYIEGKTEYLLVKDLDFNPYL